MTNSEDSNSDSSEISDTRCDNNLNVTYSVTNNDRDHDDNRSDSKPFVVQVERPALTQEDFHGLYGLSDGKLSGKEILYFIIAVLVIFWLSIF